MQEKIQLNVLGLSYSQAQTGAYALIMSDETDEIRIPIVIGTAEAQSIAITLEEMTTPRPLTHDLFKSVCEGFGIEVTEINIYRLEAGVFYSEIVCKSKTDTIRIDARTSDSVAIALRFECPIYTTKEIIDKAGISMTDNDDFSDEGGEEYEEEPEKEKVEKKGESRLFYGGTELDDYSVVQLNELMQEAILNEDYERASKLRDEIKRRK